MVWFVVLYFRLPVEDSRDSPDEEVKTVSGDAVLYSVYTVILENLLSRWSSRSGSFNISLASGVYCGSVARR